MGADIFYDTLRGITETVFSAQKTARVEVSPFMAGRAESHRRRTSFLTVESAVVLPAPYLTQLSRG